MLAEESPEEEEVSASGVAAAAQELVAAFQVSPEAHSQFGAVLVDSKQAVQDLLQLEEQVIHPYSQARH